MLVTFLPGHDNNLVSGWDNGIGKDLRRRRAKCSFMIDVRQRSSEGAARTLADSFTLLVLWFHDLIKILLMNFISTEASS